MLVIGLDGCWVGANLFVAQLFDCDTVTGWGAGGLSAANGEIYVSVGLDCVGAFFAFAVRTMSSVPGTGGISMAVEFEDGFFMGIL